MPWSSVGDNIAMQEEIRAAHEAETAKEGTVSVDHVAGEPDPQHRDRSAAALATVRPGLASRAPDLFVDAEPVFAEELPDLCV